MAVAASAAAHALFLGLIVWRLGSAPALTETPAMSVTLMRPWHARAPAPRPPPDRKDRRTGAEGPALPRPDERPERPAPDVREADGVPEPRPAGGVGRTLRGLLGCEHAALLALTAQERERCRDQLAAQGVREQGAAQPRLNFDRRGDLTRNPEPYLQRKAKDGCKARAGGDVGAMGEIGAAAGVGCAWSFLGSRAP